MNEAAQNQPKFTSEVILETVERLTRQAGGKQFVVVGDSPFDIKDSDLFLHRHITDMKKKEYAEDHFNVKYFDVKTLGIDAPQIWHILEREDKTDEEHLSLYPTMSLLQVQAKKNKDIPIFYVLAMEVMDTTDFGQYSRHFLIAEDDAVEKTIKYMMDVKEEYERMMTVGKYITVVGSKSRDAKKYKLSTNVKWNDLYLEQSTKQMLRSDIEFWLHNEEAFKKNDLPHKRSYFLVGPPGNGKSMSIKILASEYPQLSFYTFDFDANVATQEGTLSERLFALPSMAQKHKPAVIIFEDLDRYFAYANEKPTSLSPILQVLDGVIDIGGLMFIATANHPELLDEALATRKGRFDLQITFKNPDEKQRMGFLKRLFANKVDFDEKTTDDIVSITEGTSYAFIKSIYERTLFRCLKEDGSIDVCQDDVLQTMLGEMDYLKRLMSKKQGTGSIMGGTVFDAFENEYTEKLVPPGSSSENDYDY